MKVQTLGRFGKVSKEQRGKGVFILLDTEEIEALRTLSRDHETEPYLIDFSYYNVRSMSANDRFHAILGEYADHVGLTKDEAKMQIKHEHGVIIPYREGFIPPTREGVFVEIYGQIEFQISSKVYTKSEMYRAMEGLDMKCAQAGVVSGFKK
jgi:hypothetical protein